MNSAGFYPLIPRFWVVFALCSWSCVSPFLSPSPGCPILDLAGKVDDNRRVLQTVIRLAFHSSFSWYGDADKKNHEPIHHVANSVCVFTHVIVGGRSSLVFSKILSKSLYLLVSSCDKCRIFACRRSETQDSFFFVKENQDADSFE